ncbi:MAG: DHHA1 domain-containing protein [Candidatus Margulisiibacteriota bacterium]
MNSPKYLDLKNIIEANKFSMKALLLAHVTPDYDALGSLLAFAKILKRYNIPYHIAVDAARIASYAFLHGFNELQEFDPNWEFNTVFMFDTPTFERTVVKDYLLQNRAKFQLINIDHHLDNVIDGDFNLVEERSSVGELLYFICQANGWEVDYEMATNIFCSMVGDTGGFRFNNTTADTFFVANECVKLGVKSYVFNELIFENKKPEFFEVIKNSLVNLKINWNSGYAYTFVLDDNPDYGHEIIDFIRKLEKIEVFLVFRKWKDNITKISLRSKHNFDVAAFSHQFNGGGHTKAAGINLENTLDEAIEIIIPALEKELLNFSRYGN